jgi:hypothetical protein
VVLLLLDPGIGFTVKHDDNVGRSKTLGEARVMHVTPKRLAPGPLGAKAVPFSVVVPAMALDVHAVLSTCPIVFPMSLTTCHSLKGSM